MSVTTAVKDDVRPVLQRFHCHPDRPRLCRWGSDDRQSGLHAGREPGPLDRELRPRHQFLALPVGPAACWCLQRPLTGERAVAIDLPGGGPHRRRGWCLARVRQAEPVTRGRPRGARRPSGRWARRLGRETGGYHHRSIKTFTGLDAVLLRRSDPPVGSGHLSPPRNLPRSLRCVLSHERRSAPATVAGLGPRAIEAEHEEEPAVGGRQPIGLPLRTRRVALNQQGHPAVWISFEVGQHRGIDQISVDRIGHQELGSPVVHRDRPEGIHRGQVAGAEPQPV